MKAKSVMLCYAVAVVSIMWADSVGYGIDAMSHA